MYRFRLLLLFAIAACGAPMRNVPASVDPSNPEAAEGVVPPPPIHLAEQKPAAPDTGAQKGGSGMEGDMPGMQHGGAGKQNTDMPGMQHDMPGMQHEKPAATGKPAEKPAKGHDMGNMPGMQHDKPAKPEKPADNSDKQRGMDDMPGMQHGKTAPDKGAKPEAPGHGQGAAADESKNKPAKTVYRCPMHPEVVSDKPGRCPKCGMKLELQKAEGTP